MSAMNGNKAIDLLFGVAGGSEINDGSGKRIKESIDGIVQKIHGAGSTKLEFTADTESLKRLRKSVEDTLKDIKVTVKLDKDFDTSSGNGKRKGGVHAAELAESAKVRKVIGYWREYYELQRKANQTPLGHTTEHQEFADAAKTAFDTAKQALADYELSLDSLVKVHHSLTEMATKYDIKDTGFVAKLIDIDAIKQSKAELTETIDLFKYAHKLQLAAVKESRGDESRAAASADASEARKAAEEARAKYQLYGKQGVEIDKLLTAQKKELAHAIKMQAAAEQDAVTKRDDSATRQHTEDLKKLVEMYRKVKDAQTEKARTTTAKDYGAAQQKEIQAYEAALKYRRSLNLSDKESGEIAQRLVEENIRLTETRVAYRAAINETTAADKRAAEAAAKTESERQSSLQTLRQLHKAIQQFDALAQKPSTVNFVDSTQLAEFSAKVEEIKHKLVALDLNASKADIDMEQLARVENLDRLLFDVTSLTQGLRNLQTQTGGAAIANLKLETSYHKLANRAHDYMTRIQSYLSRDPAMMQEMQHLVDRLHQGDFGSVAEGAQAFQKLQFRIKQAGLEAETLGEQIRRVFKEKFGFGVMATAALYARRAISEVYQTVVDLDTKLTELKIVSGATGQEMVKYFDDAAAAAKRVAASITDIIDATTVYRRLGFEMSKSLDFAELTTMYSKVGNVDMSAAEDSVTSIIKAFDLDDVEQVRLAMDQLVYVGNNFAISSSQLGEGLQNSGAALMAAGNTFTESLALLTASNNTLQDISKASTAMRTIAARVRQSSAELEEIGDEGLAAEYNTTSKYRAKLLAITGVDILENDLKTFRSTYEILKDISEVWGSLEDIDQAAVTEMLGGVRNQSQIASILTTFGDAEDIMKETAEAAGSMQSAYENYVDSIQGRLNTLTASSQQLFNNLLDSDLIKNGVSAVATLVEALNALIDTFGVLPTIGAGVGIAKLISSVGGAKLIALINAPTYVPVATRSELAA